MRSILISLLMLTTGASVASAVEFNYDFKSDCSNPKHSEYTDLMKTHQAKLSEVVVKKDLETFYKAWGKVVGVEYDGKADVIDTIFVFKSYPNAGLMFAYNDGCLVGARVFHLDVLNKILEKYLEAKRGV